MVRFRLDKKGIGVVCLWFVALGALAAPGKNGRTTQHQRIGKNRPIVTQLINGRPLV